MKTLLSSTAIALVLAGGLCAPAFAQDEPAASAEAPSAEAESTQKSEEPKATVKEAAETVTLVKTLPADSRPISQYYQEPVYDPDNNQVGDTNDLLIDESGKVTTVIIGVGGFLGVGEKNVAIPFDALELTENKDGETQLTLNTTKGALEQAPGYVFDGDAQAWVPAPERAAAADDEQDAADAKEDAEETKDKMSASEGESAEMDEEPMADKEPADSNMTEEKSAE